MENRELIEQILNQNKETYDKTRYKQSRAY